MHVTLIAATRFHDLMASVATGGGWMAPDDRAFDAELLGEYAGRACYQSWSRPNPETATSAGYFANILEQGHFSILEHGSASFYVTGVSRSLTHELVRHRHLSYSQLSQRFIAEDDADFVVPPAVRDMVDGSQRSIAYALLEESQKRALETYGALVELLTDAGLGRKQVREAARSVLPNMTETRLVVSGNHRAWRDFLAKRWSAHADAEIREFAGLVLAELRNLAPNVYQDISGEPSG